MSLKVDSVSRGDGSTRALPLTSIRTDRQTQHRATVDPAIVAAYTALIADGTAFPPISVWWDGCHYWISHGYHRLTGAQIAGAREILSEIGCGLLEDAQWHNYAANSVHGLRRTAEKAQQVVLLALKHPLATGMSSIQLAKHLQLPETTLRRWRTKRSVRRGRSTYWMSIANIESKGKPSKARNVRDEFSKIRQRTSPDMRRLLLIIYYWML